MGMKPAERVIQRMDAPAATLCGVSSLKSASTHSAALWPDPITVTRRAFINSALRLADSAEWKTGEWALNPDHFGR